MPRCFVCGRTADEEDLARDGDRLLCREHYDHERRAAQSRERRREASKMRMREGTVAKITRRDNDGTPMERGVEHAKGTPGDTRTLCGVSLYHHNTDWYYSSDRKMMQEDFAYSPPGLDLTGEVTCKRCLAIMQKGGE